jgi:hypothetical protein
VRRTIGGDQLPYSTPAAAQTDCRAVGHAPVTQRSGFRGYKPGYTRYQVFYLGTLLDEPEFMRISLKFILLDLQLKA